MSSDFSPELRAELLDDFYAEADEHLGNIRVQLTVLEAALGKTAPELPVLESLFRSMHSFKGISAMVGVHSAEQLAHAAEDYLRQLTRGEISLTAAGLELLVATTQRLEQIVTAHRLHQPFPETAALLAELEASSPRIPRDEKAAPAAAVAPATTEDTASRLETLQARGLAPWGCTFLPSRELDQRGININAVRTRLGAIGEIISATPSVRPEGSIAFDFVLGLRELPTDLAAWERDGMFLRAIEATPAAKLPEPGAPGQPGAANSGGSPSLFIAPSHIVRVELSRLDELMRITGELVIHRSRLEERINQATGDTSALKEVAHGLARALRQLRAAITRVRLVPVAEIFTRMPFVIRDLARESGKQVRLELGGQQTEIDKYLVERLKEPLLHLVRNAFSHGVESPEERIAAGKPAEAVIQLRATAAGEFVLIHIRDDGRGVDPEKVAQRAQALGLTVPEPLDSAGLLTLLCEPGFSTREEADRASGRGVGMAVVYNTVRELGGSLALDSHVGGGTEFTLRLPLTLSIAETIIVSAGEQTCAVPQGFIDEIIQIDEAEVRTIKQSEVIPYRDGILPLVRLRSMFGAGAAPRPRLSILVLSSERGSTGLVVDRVHTQREVVVRPMQDPLLQVPGVSGATELGDGRPVLILDAIAITSGVVRPRASTGALNSKNHSPAFQS